MNKTIIDQFEKLLIYTKFKLKELEDENIDKKKINVYKIKVRQYFKILSILKNYLDEITKNNLDELLEIDGIGKGTITRIIEILETKKLAELDDFSSKVIGSKSDKSKIKIINELEEVINIGNKLAIDLYNQGIKSVKDLKKKQKEGKIELNDKVLLGLKYHGIVKKEIPRDEITETEKFLQKKIKKINKDMSDDDRYCLIVCGSYRREKEVSNDIDILLTKFGTNDKSSKNKVLEKFLHLLDDFLIDDLTGKSSPTKYMGFYKYKSNPVRRIDIRYVPYTSYFPALLYFTGSKDLNTKLRKMAKSIGYKINEYNVTNNKGDKVKINSEKDIFKILDLEYIEPKFR